MSADLDSFLASLKAEHAALTVEFERAQGIKQAADADYRQAHAKITAFRAKYGGHLKLLAEGSISVTE